MSKKLSMERLESRVLFTAVPTLVPDAYTLCEDQSLVVGRTNGVLANDTGVTIAELVSSPAHGSLMFRPDGSFGYRPYEDYVGEDSFVYKDQVSGESARVLLTICPDETGIRAVDDYYSVLENEQLSIPKIEGVLNNDIPNGKIVFSSLLEKPLHGTVSMRADGSLSYTPHDGFHGEDSFAYRLFSYGKPHGSDIGRIFITVVSINEDPVANDDAYAVDEDGVLTVEAGAGVLANDTDADSDPLSASLSQVPQYGGVVFSEDGGFVYTPNADFFGIDSFTYEALDGQGGTTLATVRITVSPIQDIPIAVDDYWCFDDGLELYPNGALAVGCPEMGVLDNDTDADGDELMASLTSFPELGILEFNQDGTFIYWCDPAWSGIATFTYQITDGTHLSNEATVHIKIRP